MDREYTRHVGARGQITIPNAVRDRFGIDDGDEIVVVETDKGVFINAPWDDERLAAADDQERADRSRDLAAEMAPTSGEATDHLGDAPDRDAS